MVLVAVRNLKSRHLGVLIAAPWLLHKMKIANKSKFEAPVYCKCIFLVSCPQPHSSEKILQIQGIVIYDAVRNIDLSVVTSLKHLS
jgi:hypothetical protein